MFTLNIEAVSFKDLSSPYLEKQPKFKSFSIGGKKKQTTKCLVFTYQKASLAFQLLWI